MMHRRGFLAGLLAAPVIIRTPGLLMPVKPAIPEELENIYGGIIRFEPLPPGTFFVVKYVGGLEIDLNDGYPHRAPFCSAYGTHT